ncbi:probable serine incorporator isoform X2 [Symsagittifera roscoffensis]|uniref:probable serine incorporator isoform X2 n=1 Tax=Symsagittifera roscoffensis TaxID=84072 RepID=UPI00307C5448
MGLVLGTCCAAQLACCVGSSICSCCCSCLPSVKASTSTRLMYATMLSLIALLSMILLSTPVEEWLEKIALYYDFCEETQVQEGSLCRRVLGYSAVYHVCLAGTLFFLFLSVLTLCAKSSADPRVKFDRGFWLWKFLLLILLIVGVFFIPTTKAFYTTMYVGGLIGGFLFILVQIIMLIDFAHSWNESWVGNMEDSDNKCWLVMLITSMLFMFTSSLLGVVLLFIYYTNSDCLDNIVLIVLLVLLCVIISVLSIIPKVQEENPRSGLLQASVTSLFAVGLTWMALSSDPRDQCNPTGEGAQWVSIVVALFVANFTVLIATRTSNKDEDSSSNYAAGGDDDERGGQAVVDDEEDEVSYSHSLFHLAMAAACLYIMMTLTYWFSPMKVDNSMTDSDFADSSVSKWVKISSSWVCFATYIWVLFAPIVLSDREF